MPPPHPGSALGRGLAGITLVTISFGFGCLQRQADADRQRSSDGDRTTERAAMVRDQIEERGVKNKRVLAAMRRVKRHLFVPSSHQANAYADHPLPIGKGQTISQPYIVAYMTEALRLKPSARVLEIGTGSGYQAAVLGAVAKAVYTIEIVPELGKQAKKLLSRLGYRNIHVRVGDGYAGWPKKAPFDAVILTAAPVSIPKPLIRQLKKGGALVAPMGPAGHQRLIRITKSKDGRIRREHLMDVRFVPMTGKTRGE
jgi:protein-L-isoaspartate(D-aspartate) O-methyltransferase